MKEWAWTLILLSVFGKLMKNLLPRGEKSPLHAPLRFLLSLSLVAVMLFPWMRLLRREIKPEEYFSFPESESVQSDADTYILEQMGKTMKRSVDTAFPDIGYTLEIYSDENQVPTEVLVLCEDPEKAKQIASFIEKNYGLTTNAK